jgi:hypothetical protein
MEILTIVILGALIFFAVYVGFSTLIYNQMSQHKEIMDQIRNRNETLSDILKECKRNSDLVEKYNKAYHI